MIASHMLHQHHLQRSTVPEAVEINASINASEASAEEDPAHHVKVRQGLQALQVAHAQPLPKVQAVLLLLRREACNLKQIGARHGLPRGLLSKSLSEALLHCRQRLGEKE